MIAFFVPGEPAAQGRPRTRILRLGRRAVAQIYNPHNADEWKARVSIIARPFAPKPSLSGPVRLSATFLLPRPESHYRGKARELRLEAPLWHFIKPDGDNYAKALIDALTSVGMWHDDCQVADQRIMKFYTNDEPGCHVSIEPIDPCLTPTTLTENDRLLV